MTQWRINYSKFGIAFLASLLKQILSESLK